MSTQHKQRKSKDRELQQRRQRHDAAGRRAAQKMRGLYPEVAIADADGAPPELVEAVSSGLKTFRLDDEKKFAPVYREFFRNQRRAGYGEARLALHHAVHPPIVLQPVPDGTVTTWRGKEPVYRAIVDPNQVINAAELRDVLPLGAFPDFRMPVYNVAQILDVQLICIVGQALFDHIPEIQNFLPFVDIQVFPRGGRGERWDVYFQAMLVRPTPWGPRYYSPHAPELTIDGKARKLAWSRHAVERVCERAFPSCHTYAGLGDAYAFLSDHIYFEVVALADGGPAISMYLPCNEPFITRTLAEQIVGTDKFVEGETYAMRLGYMPIVEQQDLWVVTTLKLPGFAGTPERALLNQSGLPPERRWSMQAQIDHLERAQLNRDLDVSILKWFHENGQPQVKALDQPLYRTYVGNRLVAEDDDAND